MTLYFISGASGTGKTSIIPYLKKLLEKEVAVHDFDDIGVPNNLDNKWRQKSTEEWLQKLLHDDKDACLLGQIVLGELLACPSAQQIGNINFYFLDVSDFERIQRLKKYHSYIVDQHMLNWASWLRMHHQDPQWMKSIIQESSLDIMNFSKVNYLTNYDEVANIRFLDTTDLTLIDIAQKLSNWIKNTENSNIPNYSYQLQFNSTNAFKIVDQKLFEFNKVCVPATQKPEVISINFTIKNDDKIIAGICADMYIWNILYISVFFVEKDYRYQGLGTILLNHVEEKAKQLGAILSHLDTFDFQAKDFYIKHGYEVFGVLDDCPKGHKRYYMKKVFGECYANKT